MHKVPRVDKLVWSLQCSGKRKQTLKEQEKTFYKKLLSLEMKQYALSNEKDKIKTEREKQVTELEIQVAVETVRPKTQTKMSSANDNIEKHHKQNIGAVSALW